MTQLEHNTGPLRWVGWLIRGGEVYPWIAMGVVFIGTFMVVLDTTIINVALPQIGLALGSESGIEWVVTAYLLAVGTSQPLTGWLADRYGRKRLFVSGLALFALGSLLAALSPSLQLLVASRVVQGLGGGALIPVGMVMIYELFPPDRRGSALGVWGVASMAAPAFGPVIGGYLVTNVSWHWLFLINVPIGVIGIGAALRLLRETGYKEDRPFHGLGFGLITVGLITLLVGVERASERGWGSPQTLGLLFAGCVFLLLFTFSAQRARHPLIDLSIFRVSVFTLTLVVTGVAVIVQFGILVLVPLQLQTIRGFTALEVGTMLIPMGLTAALTFPLGGRMTDRIGARVPVILGSILLGVSAMIFAQLEVDSPIYVIEIAVACQGLGFGLALMPNAVTGLNALPKKFVAQATAVRQLNNRVMASFGVAILTSILTMRLDGLSTTSPEVAGSTTAQDAYNAVFTLIGLMAGAVAVAGFFLPARDRNRRFQAERAAEYGAAAGIL